MRRKTSSPPYSSPFARRGDNRAPLLTKELVGGNVRILGIDPGFSRTGLGVVDIRGMDTTHVWHDVFETPAGDPFSDRLMALHDEIRATIQRFHPAVVCVEALFFQRNVKTALTVGMARGVILLTVAEAGVPLIELTPSQVKQGIAGWGGADKLQLQRMVTRLLKLTDIPRPDDAADALALAICGGTVAKRREAEMRSVRQATGTL